MKLPRNNSISRCLKFKTFTHFSFLGVFEDRYLMSWYFTSLLLLFMCCYVLMLMEGILGPCSLLCRHFLDYEEWRIWNKNSLNTPARNRRPAGGHLSFADVTQAQRETHCLRHLCWQFCTDVPKVPMQVPLVPSTLKRRHTSAGGISTCERMWRSAVKGKLILDAEKVFFGRSKDIIGIWVLSSSSQLGIF